MNSDMNTIIDKYFQGETTLVEEQELRTYMLSDEVHEDHEELRPLFSYFHEESQLGKDFEPDLSFTRGSGGKIRFMLPRILAVAASVILLFTVANIWMGVESDTVYKNKYTEVEDPREGLSIALETLGFASHTLDNAIQPVSHLKELPDAIQPVSHLKELKRTAVFDFNK